MGQQPRVDETFIGMQNFGDWADALDSLNTSGKVLLHHHSRGGDQGAQCYADLWGGVGRRDGAFAAAGVAVVDDDLASTRRQGRNLQLLQPSFLDGIKVNILPFLFP